VSGIAPRDPVADARRSRRGFIVLGAVLGAVLVVAAAVLVATRTPDLEYTYTLRFTEDGGHPHTLLLPLPSDARLAERCRYLGNGTPVEEDSAYGRVLRVDATGDLALTCSLLTFEPLPVAFSTAGSSAGGQPAARVFLDAGGAALHPVVDISFRESGKVWNTTKYVQGDLFEGWTTLEVREVVEPYRPYGNP
jgi:hypothetical protein